MLALLLLAAAPDYVVIRRELAVERPADAVWARIGDYCAIGAAMKINCAVATGTGEVGTVRVLRDGATVEPMVARTAHSYTYLQTVGAMAAYHYHGTLAVEPVSATRSRLSYTLFYDQAAMPSDAVRASEHTRLGDQFGRVLAAMKDMAEAPR